MFVGIRAKAHALIALTALVAGLAIAAPPVMGSEPGGETTYYLRSATGSGNADLVIGANTFSPGDEPTFADPALWQDIPLVGNGAPNAIWDPNWRGEVDHAFDSFTIDFWQKAPVGELVASEAHYDVTIWVGSGADAQRYDLPQLDAPTGAFRPDPPRITHTFETMHTCPAANNRCSRGDNATPEVPLDIDPAGEPLTVSIAGRFIDAQASATIAYDSVAQPSAFTTRARTGEPTPTPTPTPTVDPTPPPGPGFGITITSPAQGEVVESDFVAEGITVGTAGGAGEDLARDAGEPTEPAGSSTAGRGGALAGDHPALATLEDPMREALAAETGGESGLLAVAPAADGSKRLTALFEGEAPPGLPTDLDLEGWTLEVHEHAGFERLPLVYDRVVELEEPLGHGPPVPEDSIGIGPGSTLLINRGTSTALCTAAFIFQDGNTGKVYLGTAGHCFMPGSAQSTHGQGADFNPANVTRVRVCVANCVGGQTGLETAALGIYPGATRDLGPATGPKLAYARQRTGNEQVGHDFGIVEIPPELWGEIRTDMPVWKGPGTSDTSRLVGLGDVVVHYGNSVAMGEVFPTKGRAGIGSGANSLRWLANSAAGPGDSGSAVNIGTVGGADIVEGQWAAGVLTHLSCCISGGVPHITAGTNTARAIQMAQQDAGFKLQLIHDPSQIGEVTPSEFTVEVRLMDDSSGTIVDWTGVDSYDGSAWSHGFTDVPGGDVTLQARLLEDGDEVATDSVGFTVSQTQASTQIFFTEDSADSGEYLDDVLIEAQLVDAGGNPVAGKDVVFKLSGVDGERSWTVTTDGDGLAGQPVTLEDRPGGYLLRATFAGDDDFEGSESSTFFVIERRDTETDLTVEGRGANRVLHATLTHAGDDTAVEGRTIEFFADGEHIGSAVTDSDGVAALEPPPRYRGGSFTFEAVFEGDGFYNGSSGTDSS